MLEGRPDPFASDPPAKRKGMVAFQPDALTISRGELWSSRRRFTEAVLKSPAARTRLLKGWEAVCREELERMLTGPVAVAGGALELGRLARRSSGSPAG